MLNLGKKNKLTDQFPDVERIQSLLSQRVYDEKRHVYYQPKSIMSIFEMPLLTGGGDELAQEIANCFETILDDDVTIRLWRLTHPCLENVVSAMANQYRNGDPLFECLATNQQEYYLNACRVGLPSQQGRMPLMDSRLFCEIILKADPSRRDEYEKKADLCRILTEKLTLKLKTAGIPTGHLTPPSLLSLLRFVLLGEDDFKWDTHYDHYELLYEQVTPLGSEFVVDDEFVKTINKQVKRKISTFVPEKWPSMHHLSESVSMLARADKNLALSSPHMVSIAFTGISKEKAKSWANRSYMRLQKTYKTKLAQLIPKLNEQFEEWQYLRPALLDDTLILTRNIFLVTLLSNDENYDKAISETQSLFNSLEIKLRLQKYIQLPLLLANMPGKIADGYWDDMKKLGLVKTMTLTNTISLAPIVGDWKGTMPKGFVAPGTHGQFATLDIASLPADNYNVAVSATSGSGKSVLIQNLITETLAKRGQAFVIDKGGSYKKMCELLGGTYIDAQNLRLNPFHGLAQVVNNTATDEDTKKMYFALVRDLVAVIVSPKGELQDATRTHILEAVVVAFEQKGVNSKLDDVYDALKSISQRIKKEHESYDARLNDIITVLSQYVSSGIYGQYFNAYQEISNNDFIVLEMNSLENNPDLLQAVLFSIMNTISQAMYLSARSRRKLCVIDEAWKLFSSNNKDQALFIEQGYRTSRKHGGSFIAITQGITDYFQNNVTKACWNSSDIKIFLRQNSSAFKQFQSEHPNFFNAYEVQALNSFQTAEQAGYSSLLLKAGTITSVHRLYLTPQMRALFSTTPHHTDRIEELVKGGMKIWDAVCQLAQEAGYVK